MTPENRYQRGKIYKLISNQTDDTYYGSTIEIILSNRVAKHRNNYKSWLEGKFPYITSFEIIKYPDAKIVLVENFPCTNRYELIGREQHYIDNNKCVNKLKAYTGLDRQGYQKQYRDDHKEKAKEYNTQYRIDNHDSKLENDRLYYQKNKEKINQKISCECGGHYILIGRNRHLKTKKHLDYEILKA